MKLSLQERWCLFLNMKGTPITVIVSLDSVELTVNVEVLNLLTVSSLLNTVLSFNALSQWWHVRLVGIT